MIPAPVGGSGGGSGGVYYYNIFNSDSSIRLNNLTSTIGTQGNTMYDPGTSTYVKGGGNTPVYLVKNASNPRYAKGCGGGGNKDDRN